MTTNLISRIGAMRLTPVRFFGFWAVLFALVFTLSSCSDDLDVQQSYPFTVEVMPFAEKIVKGQTVELRFEIKPEGNYTNTPAGQLLACLHSRSIRHAVHGVPVG